ncbi:hypothetical protein VTK73DRAFT_8457 [Phialemonium thermophilum]|uniref:Zn(2)-C6 fungal-type domain-containing protein n=1 Tax=Phialemonium thermophilum TaxID=223376 RepID=A0ABR3W8N8_9PEZI
MSVPLRPILPRVQDDDGGHRKRSLGPKQMPAKRSPVLAACDGCRAKRIKCDGERPTCSQCEKRKSSCSYRAQPGLTPFESLKQENKSLKSQSGDLLRFIDLLKASPGAMCLDMVDQLRDGATPACLLARLDLAVETLAASAMAVASVVEAGASGQAPSDLAELELALVTRHPRAFSPLSPPDVSSLDLRLVGVPCMTNVPRWTHSWGLQERDGVLMDTSEERPSKRQRSPRDDSQHSPTKGPTPPSTINPKNILQRANVTDGEALYVDARLDHLSLRQWTKVSVSDRFVAAALSLFLRNEHPLVACFDEDLFLRDFSSGGTHYCSPLLVNALLAFACVCRFLSSTPLSSLPPRPSPQILDSANLFVQYSYTPIEAQAAVLRHKFFAEAESLWKLEWETPSLTGVSAAILMKLACDNSGDDELGLFYLTGASTMAGHLHVLDGSVPAQTWDEETTASAVAWGLFNGQSLHAINFPQASLVKKPPSLPMRGAVVTGADGEPRTVGRPLPSYMGHTALVASKFWLIIHEANHQIETNGPLLLPAVMEFYHELLAWADDLPTDTARSDSNPHHVLTMQ